MRGKKGRGRSRYLCLGAYAESFSPFVQDPKPTFVVEHAKNTNRLRGES